MRLFLGLASFLLLISSPALAQRDNLILGTVVGIDDGDIIRVNSQGKPVSVRLACVDAPDMRQTPWGEQSKQRLQQLLPIGTQVSIKRSDIDNLGNTVGEVVTSNTGININIKMVSEGKSVVYTQYLNGCVDNKNEYLNAEEKAKQQRLGYWNQTNPVMPWDYGRN